MPDQTTDTTLTTTLTPATIPQWAQILLYLTKTVGVGSVFAGALLWGGWQLSDRVVNAHTAFLKSTADQLEHNSKALETLATDQKEILQNQRDIIRILDNQTKILEKWSKP